MLSTTSTVSASILLLVWCQNCAYLQCPCCGNTLPQLPHRNEFPFTFVQPMNNNPLHLDKDLSLYNGIVCILLPVREIFLAASARYFKRMLHIDIHHFFPYISCPTHHTLWFLATCENYRHVIEMFKCCQYVAVCVHGVLTFSSCLHSFINTAVFSLIMLTSEARPSFCTFWRLSIRFC